MREPSLPPPGASEEFADRPIGVKIGAVIAARVAVLDQRPGHRPHENNMRRSRS